MRPAPPHPSINATSTLTLGGFLDLSIDRTRSPGASNLTISGTLNRGGTLRVINTGPALQLGDSFTVTISAAQLTGSFASTLLPALDYGLAWNTSQFASNGTITVVANTAFTPSTVTLTPATTNQQIHGIGANFCLGPQGIAWNTSQFNLAFSPAGLNISFVRLSNSFECSLDEPDIFWSGWDSDNVRFIQMFRAIQPDGLITMASWSPPGRYKSTGSANGGTLAKSGNAYRYTDFANWWLRSLQYLRDNSTLPVEQAIPDFISIQNESDFTPSGNPFYAAWQAGCYLDSMRVQHQGRLSPGARRGEERFPGERIRLREVHRTRHHHGRSVRHFQLPEQHSRRQPSPPSPITLTKVPPTMSATTPEIYQDCARRIRARPST